MSYNHSEQEQVDEILRVYGAGDFQASEMMSRDFVKTYPHNTLAWKLLGVSCALQKKSDEAVIAFNRVVELAPEDHTAHGDLALALEQAGDVQAAISAYGKAVALQPHYAEAYFNLGNLYKALGDNKAAVTSFEAAIAVKADFFPAYVNLGNTLSTLGRFEEAVNCYHQLVILNPGNAEAFNNLGVVLDELEQHAQATDSYQQAITLNPHFYQAYCNLGDSLNAQYRVAEAADQYRRAIAIKPDFLEAYFKLGVVQKVFGAFLEAIASFGKVVALDSKHAEAYSELGFCYDAMARYVEANNSYLTALKINPGLVSAHHRLALNLSVQGYHDQALDSFNKAVSIDPNDVFTHHGLLGTINYHPDLSSEQIYAYYVEYNRRFGLPLLSTYKTYSNSPNPDKRLKVGYVAATFYQHSTRYFIEPLLANHDRSQLEVFAYAQTTPSDQMTAQYQHYVDHWIPTRGMSDEALAERIRADGIDILVDVAGHTGHNRLQVFARKPVPVSLHWLDFGYTTGLTAIDYYLTDQATIPEGSEHLFSEKLWKLPGTAYVYRPASDMGEVNDLPAKARGYVTFGTLSRSVRMNHRTISAWSNILKAVPNSKLVLNSVNFSTPEMQQLMIKRFEERGINQDRLDIGLTSPPWDVLRGIDIGLDCFPHNSGTTLFETLYMGIPFVTLASRPSVGRLGASVLHGLGHPEWIADTEQDYIAKAIALAQNLDGLAALRQHLRSDMQHSLLMDEPGFARSVEAAYRKMWQRWCAAQDI